MTIKKRNFGKERLQVSEIGLGTWQLGGDWGHVDEETAMATLATAVETGVTFLDTADVYGLGKSETLIGKFLAQSRVRPQVATKLGRFPKPGWPENFSLDSFRAHTLASLERLGVDKLDLTQLHCIPTEQLARGEVFDWLRTLKDEGLIRRFGVSVESMEEALLCLQQGDLASLQIIFNIFRQKPITELFGRAKARRVALIVRLPLASGLLAGGFSASSQFDKSDHRHYNRDGAQFSVGETFAGLKFSKGIELVGAVRELLPGGMTMAQLALRWILDFDAVSVVIPGSKKPTQVKANTRSSELPPLSKELHKALRKLYETEVSADIRGVY